MIKEIIKETYKLYSNSWHRFMSIFTDNYNTLQIAPIFIRLPRYFFHKFVKHPQYEVSWRGDYIELSIDGVRFKYPTGYLNLKRRNILYHLLHFEASNLNYFSDELMGYLKNYNPKEGDVIVDLGAYSGVFSIYCAIKMKNTGKIIAFEPSKENLKLFRKAVKINNLTNIEIIEKGIWKEKDSLNFFEHGPGSLIVSGKGDFSIKVIDLDTQLKEMKIKPEDVSFIKSDVEGAEVEALMGMKSVLKNGSPKLAIASYHLRDGKKTCFFVERFLKKFGYETETGHPKHLTTYGKKLNLQSKKEGLGVIEK